MNIKITIPNPKYKVTSFADLDVGKPFIWCSDRKTIEDNFYCKGIKLSDDTWLVLDKNRETTCVRSSTRPPADNVIELEISNIELLPVYEN